MALRYLLIPGLLVLSTTVLSQDFIDLEAQRAAPVSKEQAETEPRPQTRSDTTVTYGINGQVAATRTGVLVQNGSVAAPADTGSLFVQVQRLSEEVRRLNGIVESQSEQLRQLREQSLERYLDIDRRLSAGGVSASTAAPSPVVSATEPRPQETSSRTAIGEEAAYVAARQRVYDKEFADAVSAFNAFLIDYPNGQFAPNAHYWLGELYLVVEPANIELSRQAFQLLLDLYPDHAKVPDATYKLATVYFAKGNKDRSKALLNQVISQYSDGQHAAVGLARQFLSKNF